jgi:hypothetical protein
MRLYRYRGTPARAGPSPRLRPCGDTGARHATPRATALAGPVARRANAPGATESIRHARAGPRPPGRRESERRRSQRIRGRSPRPYERGPQRTRDPSRALPILLPIRSSPASRRRLSSPLLYLRSSDRFPGSFFVSSCSAPSLLACRRPASGLPPFTPGLPCPVFVCRSRKGGPARQRWTPLPRKPRREAEPGPEAGRRPVDLQRSTTRDQHHEVAPRTLLVQVRARSVGSVFREAHGSRPGR